MALSDPLLMSLEGSVSVPEIQSHLKWRTVTRIIS